MASWAQIEFRDSASNLIEEFIMFHDFIMIILLFILIAVIRITFLAFLRKNLDKHLLENQFAERIWTIFPALILIQIGAPSLLILYTIEEEIEWSFLLKAIGNQWFWSYEYGWTKSSSEQIAFESYIKPLKERDGESNFSTFRLLDVDSRTVLPIWLPIKIVTTSIDVLHSWTIPRLGVKADACPGRLNQIIFFIFRPGLFFGQCSEICGANHRFIPICVESVTFDRFVTWVLEKLE